MTDSTWSAVDGYWAANVLAPEGRLVTCELDPHHAEVARANLARAGLDGVVEVRVGPVLRTPESLTGPFDLTFVDADKASTIEYVEAAIGLTRPGGVIIVDNVVRGDAVADPGCSDGAVAGIRRFADALAGDRCIDATVSRTVGGESYDGFHCAVVRP